MGIHCIQRTNPLSANAHINGLDGLRTIAIIGITLFHFFPQSICGGYLGVSLFFVITGYLMAFKSKSSSGKSFHLGKYFVKRIKRIYPALLIVILTTIGIYALLAPQIITAIRPEAISIVLGYNNWWQIAQNSDYFTRLMNQSPFTHLWFLGIELQYYVVWPILFILYMGLTHLGGKRIGLLFFVLLSLIAATLMPLYYQQGVDITRLYYGTDMRIYALLFGACMGIFHVDYIFQTTGKWNILIGNTSILLVCIITFIGYITLDGQLSTVYQGGMLLFTILFCILLGLVTDNRLVLARFLEKGFFRWIGKYSYGIFLWQYPVLFLFQYLKWDQLLPYGIMLYLEIALVVLLSVWTDALIRALKSLHHFSANPQKIGSVLVLIISIPTFVMVGYGCQAIWQSAEYKATDTNELKARFAANEQSLQNQTPNQSTSQNTATTPKSDADLRNIACIGDSVMLGSAMEIKQVLPDCYIDAKVSRYVGDGVGIIKQMDSKGILGHTVLVALGTNGPLDGQYEKQTKEFLKYLGPDRQIYWVNTYCPKTGWQDSNNAYLQKIAAEHSNVHIIDWASIAAQHPEWLSGDGIHPNDQGTKVYAQLIHDTIANNGPAQ